MDPFIKLKTASQSKKIYLYKDFTWDKKKFSLNIWFLQKCLRYKKQPKFTIIKLPNQSREAHQANFKFITSYLKSEIKRFYSKINSTQIKIWFLHSHLSSTLHPAIWDCLDRNNRDRVTDHGNVLFDRLLRKFNNLPHFQKPNFLSYKISNNFNTPPTPQSYSPNFNFHKSFKNLSKTQFETSEERLLEKGLKFVPYTPITNNQFNLFKASLESIISKHPLKLNQSSINSIPSNFNELQQKFNFSQYTTIKSINKKLKDNNLILTKADKGNCTVILEKTEYIQKTEQFLTSDDFKLITSNPLNKSITSTQKILKSTTETLKFFNTNPQKLKVGNPQIPLLYSLPKIHKPNVPIRPIVSFNNSPTYLLSKFLSNIFNRDLNFYPEFAIKNSVSFIKDLQKLQFPPNNHYKIISFDVKNLFPSIPPSETIPIISDLLHTSTFPDKIASDLLELLKFSIKNLFFKFNQKIYVQEEGLSMGSPLSPFLAELFMNDLETNQIKQSHLFKNHVIFWRRYVDDIFCIFNGSDKQLNNFLVFLNSIHNRIEFTMELSVDDSLPFLDLNISLINDSLDFNIYRKPTCTNNIIPFDSIHPISQKLASFNFFFHRLFNFPLSTANYNNELHTIFHLAKINNFPYTIINNLYLKLSFKHHIRSLTSLTSCPSKQQKYFNIPYIPQFEKIYNSLKNSSDFQLAFNHLPNLNNFFSRKKDLVETNNRNGIYRLTCSCGMCYIGQTKRAFCVRLKEHLSFIHKPERYFIGSNNIKSTFAEHLINNNHCMSTATLIHPNVTGPILEFLESVYIKQVNDDELINDQIEFNLKLKYNSI